jgi:hypothetical protein
MWAAAGIMLRRYVDRDQEQESEVVVETMSDDYAPEPGRA